MMAWWTAFLGPVAVRFARQRRWFRPWPDRLSWHDALLAVALGIGVAVLAGGWLAPFSVPASRALGSPDFGEYCALIDLYLEGRLHEWGINRSRAAGAIAGLTVPYLGIFDALLFSAMCSLALIVAGTYIWARALHSRSAGVAAAVLVGAVGPLAAMGRTLTFYPVITAGLTLACAGAAAAARWRTPFALLLAGLGSGIALLVDARGLIWAVPCVGIAALAALMGPARPGVPRWRGLGWRSLALALPLVWSFQLGKWAYPPLARTLEGHVGIYQELRERGVTLPPWEHPTGRDSQYRWGRSDPRHIPWTLLFVADQGRWVPDWYRELPQVKEGWQRTGAPWLAPFLAATIAALVGLRRRPWLALVMVGTTLPFMVSLNGAVVMKYGHLRFVASALPFLPVVLGVGMGVIAEGSLPKRSRFRGDEPPTRPVALALLTAILVACVAGAIPTFLSPEAPWRMIWHNGEAAFATALKARDGTSTSASPTISSCADGLRKVEGDGTWVGQLPGGGSEVTPWRSQ